MKYRNIFVFPWGEIRVPEEKKGFEYPIIYGGDAISDQTVDSGDVFEVTLLTAAKRYFNPHTNCFYIAVVSPSQYEHLEYFSSPEWPLKVTRVGDMRVLLYDNILIYTHKDIPLCLPPLSKGRRHNRIFISEAVFMGGSGEGVVLLRTAV